MEIPIIYESDSVVVINKPAGIAVHDDGKGRGIETIADWFAKKYPDSKHVGEAATLSTGVIVERPGVVHRLDKDTSGCLILAKTPEAYVSLKRQFKNHTIQKEYHAFIYGRLREERGTITRPIGRAKSSVEKRATGNALRGEARPAETIYRILKEGSDNGVAFSFAAFFPRTGRTHQIRVHALAIQHAIVADSLYAPTKEPILGFTRQALHAYRVAFAEPGGKKVEVIAPYPADFAEALKTL